MTSQKYTSCAACPLSRLSWSPTGEDVVRYCSWTFLQPGQVPYCCSSTLNLKITCQLITSPMGREGERRDTLKDQRVREKRKHQPVCSESFFFFFRKDCYISNITQRYWPHAAKLNVETQVAHRAVDVYLVLNNSHDRMFLSSSPPSSSLSVYINHLSPL